MGPTPAEEIIPYTIMLSTLNFTSEYDLPSSWFAKMNFFFLYKLNSYMLPSCFKIVPTMYDSWL